MKDEETDSPLRTCVGGGGQGRPEEMERFIFDERVGLVFDLRKKAPGRGAWLKVTKESLKKACNGGFARAFKTKVETPTAEELATQMAEGIQKRLTENIQVAMRSKMAWVGGPILEDGMRSDQVDLVIIAEDAGESTRKKFGSNAERKELRVVNALDGEQLGRMAGKDRVSVLGVAGPLAQKIEIDVAHLKTLRAFGG